MKGLLWVLALFSLAVAVSLAARYNDGYLLLVLPPYRVELSLNLAILLCLGAFLLFHGLLRALALALSLPRRARAHRERQEQQQQQEPGNTPT
jgi:HemY protein